MKRCEFEATGSRFCECPKCFAVVMGIAPARCTAIVLPPAEKKARVCGVEAKFEKNGAPRCPKHFNKRKRRF